MNSLSQNLYIKSLTCLTYLLFKLAKKKKKGTKRNTRFLLPFVPVDLLLPGPFSVKTKKTLLPSHYRMSPYRLYLLNASLDVLSFFWSFRLKKCLFKGFRNLLFFRTSFGYVSWSVEFFIDWDKPKVKTLVISLYDYSYFSIYPSKF